VLEVAVAPPVVGDDEEDVEAERRGGLEAQLDHPHDVALAAPDREVARRERPVLRGDVADPKTAAGRVVAVSNTFRMTP